MRPLRLNLACGDYDRTRALRDGRVQPEGIDLNYIALPPEEIFWRMLQYQEFDVSELSMANYLMLVSRGECPFVAIPVFPSRFFRHGCIFVHEGAGIEKPQDLKGRKVGVPEYHMTATVWIRGFLQHDYGVAPADMRWYVGGLEQGGRRDRIKVELPSDLDVTVLPDDKVLSRMLADGELDALITARAPSTFRPGSPVKRLFPRYWEVEREYYRRTKLFPIMHTVVMRRDVYEANPWAAQSLVKAFTRAKEISYAELGNTGTLAVGLPWLIPALEEAYELFDGDIWPYGVEANRHTLSVLIQYAREQGLIHRDVTVEELFAPNTLTTFRL